jgi:hypothetical protein
MDTSGLDHLFNSSVNYRACLCTEDIQHHPSPSVGDFGCYCGLLFQLCLVLLCHSQATVASRSAPFDRVWPHPAGSAAQYYCFEGQRPNSRHSFMLAVKE